MYPLDSLQSECLSLVAGLYGAVADPVRFAEQRVCCEEWLARRPSADTPAASFLRLQIGRAAEARAISTRVGTEVPSACAVLTLDDQGRVIAAGAEAWALLGCGSWLELFDNGPDPYAKQPHCDIDEFGAPGINKHFNQCRVRSVCHHDIRSVPMLVYLRRYRGLWWRRYDRCTAADQRTEVQRGFTGWTATRLWRAAEAILEDTRLPSSRPAAISPFASHGAQREPDCHFE